MDNKNITMADIEEFMFHSVVSVYDGKDTFNATILALDITEGKIMPFIVIPKEAVKNKSTSSIIVTYQNQENNEINFMKFSVNISNWIYPDKLPIALMILSPIINTFKDKNKFLNSVITKKFLLDDEFKQYLKLVENVNAISFYQRISNSVNCWPLSYTTTTASPISQNFDDKPYFVVNGNPENMAGAPVFVEVSNVLSTRLVFAGVWINDKTLLNEAVGDVNNFSLVLKAEAIFEELEKYRDIVQINNKD